MEIEITSTCKECSNQINVEVTAGYDRKIMLMVEPCETCLCKANYEGFREAAADESE